MRALILTIFVLTSFGLSSLLAQDQGKPTFTGSQPAQAQDSATGPSKQPSKEDNERRVMERLGPAMDWDHRKPGRELRISPRREGTDANRERE